MRILGLVFASFLLFSSPASSSELTKYQADKKGYCDASKASILQVVGMAKQDGLLYERVEIYRKIAADLSTIHIAICKD